MNTNADSMNSNEPCAGARCRNIIVGLVIHMMNAMVFGVVFAWMAGRQLPAVRR